MVANDNDVNKVLDGMLFGKSRLINVQQNLIKAMQKGLSARNAKEHAEASVKMLPTYVSRLPDKTEKGTFLALDLGGTNFRVLLITITPKTDRFEAKTEIDSRIYRISKKLMASTSEDLFDYIAKCIKDFLDVKEVHNEDIPIGFTFSFPCRQKSLNQAELITWTKGFTCSGGVDEDIGELLSKSLSKYEELKNCKLTAVCNDTVGTLMSCAFEEPDCKIGLICGTGSNACYTEKSRNIMMLSDEVRNSTEQMCINMEWGAFGDHGELDDILTSFDKEVNDNSCNVGKQTFEKLISGMYQGELVRLILRRLHAKGLVFSGEKVEALYQQASIDTSFLSMIEECNCEKFREIQDVIYQFLGVGALKSDCDIVWDVCKTVSTRAAKLAGTGISAVAHQIKQSYPNNRDNMLHITCGVDGTVYRKHPTFAKIMQETTNTILEDDPITVTFTLSNDGSGKGAALTVAACHRS